MIFDPHFPPIPYPGQLLSVPGEGPQTTNYPEDTQGIGVGRMGGLFRDWVLPIQFSGLYVTFRTDTRANAGLARQFYLVDFDSQVSLRPGSLWILHIY